MQQTTYRYLRIGQLLAIIGSLFTVTQIYLLVTQGDPLCLNQGCEIVEQLTTIPPLYFNIAGLFYFQMLFWLSRQMNEKPGFLRALFFILLTAGIGAEAVLINFQHSIAQAFCSYCLIIFVLVALLNILAGARQAIAALAVFCAVTVAFSSLNFTPTPGGSQSLPRGAIAYRPGPPTAPQGYLFFSSTCSHCKKILAHLENDTELSIYFNPIDTIEHFEFPRSEINNEYISDINRRFLATLGISEVPVMLIMQEDEMKILRGANNIIQKIRIPPPEDDRYYGTSSSQKIPGLEEGDDGCTIDTDCEDGTDLIPGN